MMHRPTILAVVFAVLLTIGCQESTKVSRDAVLSDYSAGRYSQSLAGAEELSRTTAGMERDEARYIAGLSAYRLGKDDLALQYLLTLTSSSDSTTSAKASATVGLIYSDRRQDDQARRHLRAAVGKVTGEDRAQVHYHLGLIEQRAGNWSSARTHFSTAMSYTRDATLRRALTQRMKTDGFAIQFGAYSDPSLANQQAAKVRAAIYRARLGDVRVVASTTDQGQQLYLVQAGHFTTNAAAVNALHRLNHREAMIVPAVR